MNAQRIVKLTTLDGEVYLFSPQQYYVGKQETFSSIRTAEVFVERFYYSALDDLIEIASWSTARVSFSDEFAELTEEQVYSSLAASLFEQTLFAFQTPKQAPTTFYPNTEVPVQLLARTIDNSAQEQDENVSKTGSQSSNLPQNESSKTHVKAGDPVSLVTGEENLTLTDIQLSFGLEWQRTYRSSFSDKSTVLGFGWRHNYQYELNDVVDEKAKVIGWLFMDEMGDTILFPPVSQGEVSYQVYADATCQHHETGFRLVTLNGNVQIKFVRVENLWLASEIRLGSMKQVSLEYSRNHRITQINVNRQPRLELQYNKQGLLVEIRHPKTQATLAEYQYDNALCLCSSRDEFSLLESYQYNETKLLIKRTRSTGFSHYFEWEGNGPSAKCLNNWGDEGVYRYTFEFKLNQSKVTDPRGYTWRYKHNEHGKLLESESPESRRWTYEYDSGGRLVGEVTPDGSYVTYTHNRFGQVKSKLHSSGATEHFEYNEFGFCIKHQFPDGEAIEKQFNALGQLVWQQNKDGQQERHRFDKYGRQVEQISNTGASTQWWWNDLHQLRAKKTNHSLIRYSYDETDRINGIAYPEGLVCGLERNESNLLSRLYFQNSQDEILREHRYEYDDFGRVKRICTPRGSTLINWSELAQPTEIVKADQSTLSFAYDVERNLKTIERSDGCKYEFEYTPDGQISQTINFDQVQTNYTYDQAERLSQILTRNGRVSFQYDELGRITKVNAHGKSRGVEDHYQHTLGGKLIRAHNRFSNVSYTYSGTKLVSEEQGRFSIANQYQDNGLLRSQCYDDGTEVMYEYDQFGTVCGLTIRSNGSERKDSITFEYDELQRLLRITYGGGQEQKEFDGIGRLKRQTWTGFERKYHFNAQHFLSLIIDSEKGPQHYQYDELGHLERIKTETSEESYVYDSFGNFNDESVQREHDRLIEYHGIRYDYDELGNRTSSQGNGLEQHCAYDAKGQLISVESEGHLCQFEYDALGRRTKKISENGTTEFIWQGSYLIGEYSRSGYRWYLYQPSSFIPLAVIENGDCYFFQCNQIGTPERLVDSKGQVVWQAAYDTFGFAHVEIETVKNNLRLQGQYFDIETGLHYNLARYYDPQIGRFIQPDPLGLLGGTNHYQFAPNPVSWVDPLGLCAKEDTPTVLAGHNDNSPERAVYEKSVAKITGPTIEELIADPTLQGLKPVNIDPMSMMVEGIEDMIDAGKAFIDTPSFANATNIAISAIPGRYAEKVVDELPVKTLDIEKVYRNVEISKSARESSNFKTFSKNEGRVQEELNIWPPNRGAYGPVTLETIMPGAFLDRYGFPGGTFVSPATSARKVDNATFESRALPSYKDSDPYNVYLVVKPIPNAPRSKILSWFGQRGGGEQYDLPESVKWYLDNGYLEKVSD
ncbi:RHS repeat-associated core domain-containing protein [Vibrio hyugaensis]|uniref:RHS repeat-associated core domain-containing protein n=1 Tax=Vibrio hyugaensis TaxID=1534743 RepID=UPI000CE38C09|nr:RHS repeat-associated core domain-containing protein [Vibrio hyugaensis]